MDIIDPPELPESPKKEIGFDVKEARGRYTVGRCCQKIMATRGIGTFHEPPKMCLRPFNTRRASYAEVNDVNFRFARLLEVGLFGRNFVSSWTRSFKWLPGC